MNNELLPSDEELSKASVEAGKRMGRILALYASHDLSLQRAALEAQSTLDDLCNVHAKRSHDLALVAEKLYEALLELQSTTHHAHDCYELIKGEVSRKPKCCDRCEVEIINKALTLANQHGIGVKKG